MRCTRSIVCVETLAWLPLITFDTVINDTPASSAMSLRVTRIGDRLSFRLTTAQAHPIVIFEFGIALNVVQYVERSTSKGYPVTISLSRAGDPDLDATAQTLW